MTLGQGRHTFDLPPTLADRLWLVCDSFLGGLGVGSLGRPLSGWPRVRCAGACAEQRRYCACSGGAAARAFTGRTPIPSRRVGLNRCPATGLNRPWIRPPKAALPPAPPP